MQQADKPKLQPRKRYLIMKKAVSLMDLRELSAVAALFPFRARYQATNLCWLFQNNQ